MLFPGVKEFRLQTYSSEQAGSEMHYEISSIVSHYDEVIDLPSAVRGIAVGI